MNPKIPTRIALTATFERCRHNIIWIVAVTVISLLLATADVSIFFFTAIVPMMMYEIGGSVSGILSALSILALYITCWLLAKKNRGFIAVALGMFTIDTIVMIIVVLSDPSAIVNLAFHAFIMVYLVRGTIAWRKLGKTE